MSHYFVDDPCLEKKAIVITYRFKGKNYTFQSDSGVFSSRRVDAATDILLRNMPVLYGNLLDMGCGYGCIGIVLAKEYLLGLTQIDINRKAVELAKLNSEKNGVVSDAFISDGFENVSNSFDTIIINPPIHAGKEIIFRMYDGSWRHLKLSGRLYVVIQKKHGAESSLTKLRQLFGNCETILKKKGYYIFSCHKT